MSCGISPSFEGLSPTSGQVTHVLLTRLPLYSPPEGSFLVRLACVRHAASVRSEPGSNSPVKVGSAPRRLDGSTAYAAHRSPLGTGSLTEDVYEDRLRERRTDLFDDPGQAGTAALQKQ